MIFSFYSFCSIIIFVFVLEILETYYTPTPPAPLERDAFHIHRIVDAIVLEMWRRREARRRGWFVLRINIFSIPWRFCKNCQNLIFRRPNFPTDSNRKNAPSALRWLRVARLKSWENTGLTFWRLTFSTKDNRKNAPPVLCTVGARRSVEIWRKNRFCHFTEKQKLTISFLFLWNSVCIFCGCLIICGQKALGYSTRR